VRYLVDTHTFLWFIMDNPNLSQIAKAEVENAQNELYLSVASLWEMAIKISLGKLKISLPFADFVETHITGNEFQLLSILPHHLDIVSRLDFHHRDPFDRLLVSQSLTDQIPIISADAVLDRYGVTRIW
jgi:PIN domain nuclease of toxin-antitoxin system